MALNKNAFFSEWLFSFQPEGVSTSSLAKFHTIFSHSVNLTFKDHSETGLEGSPNKSIIFWAWLYFLPSR